MRFSKSRSSKISRDSRFVHPPNTTYFPSITVKKALLITTFTGNLLSCDHVQRIKKITIKFFPSISRIDNSCHLFFLYFLISTQFLSNPGNQMQPMQCNVISALKWFWQQLLQVFTNILHLNKYCLSFIIEYKNKNNFFFFFSFLIFNSIHPKQLVQT